MIKKTKLLLTALLSTFFVGSTLLFAGCKDRPSADTSSSDGSSVNSSIDNSEVSAEYTVTYIYDNGQQDLVRKVMKGECAVQPKDPQKEGFTFAGWYAEGESEEYDFTLPVNADLILKAHWREGEDPEIKTARLSWTKDESAEFLFDGSAPRVVNVGETVRFRVRLSPYYTGVPTVKAGAETLAEGTDGYYSFVVKDSVSVAVTGLTPDTTPIKGIGTKSNPYTITTPSQLKTITEAINDEGNEKYNDAYIRLDADLHLNGEKLEPIGKVLNSSHFSGVFDGNGHSVSDFTLVNDTGIIGFFGYLVQGSVENLAVKDVDLDIETLDGHNYIVGGIVSYNLGGDITGCSFEGNISIDFAYTETLAYVGGICGFAQGYSTDYSGTISYCSVNGDISSVGNEPIFAAGGIVGATVGTAESATVYVSNSAFNGNITGASTLSGGIVGYLREYSSVANSFSSGSVNAEDVSSIAAAGGIVGLAENETAVTFSYTTAAIDAIGSADSALEVGEAVGGMRKDGYLGVDARSSFIYHTYYSDNGKIVRDGKTYDLTNFADVRALLGWTAEEWEFVEGKPVVRPEGYESVSFEVTFHFSGEKVTAEGKDGLPLTQTEDQVQINGYLPVYWVYDGSGMNNFVADSGKISYGYFFDKECTQRIPSSLLLTQNLTVYVGFADYSSVAGDYYTVINEDEIRLQFDDNGKMTMYLGAIVSNRMYVFDGERVLIRDAYFANLMYTSSTNASLDADYYGVFENGVLKIYDNVFFSEEKSMEIYAYKHNDAMGEWYNVANDVYAFLADGTGTITLVSGGIRMFTYTCLGNMVTVDVGGETILATLSADKRSMQTSDGITLSVNKFDDYTGDWEGAYSENISLSFDGMGHVTFKDKTYAYTLDRDGELSFEGYTAQFNEDGLLVLTGSDGEILLGRAGSYMGTWFESYLDYTMELYGIGKDNYGYGYDSNGVTFTYTAEYSREATTEEYYFLTMYSGTSVYGYGGMMKSTDGKSELLALGVYTPASGFIVDDYNMCYIDGFKETWNGEDGTTLVFNGLGSYEIDVTLSDGTHWTAVGYVEVTVNGKTAKVRYTYDKATHRASFVCEGKTYAAELAGEHISVSVDGGEAKVYKNPDGFGLYGYQGSGVELFFNGKSNVGLGKATLVLDGQETVYDYTVAGGTATLTLNGVAKYTAAANQAGTMLELLPAQGTKIELGLYNKMVGKEYFGAENVSVLIEGPFDLTGVTTGKLGEAEVDVLYLDANTAAIYSQGTLVYYLVWQDENNVALFDSSQKLITVLCLPDNMAGTYTAANGDTVTLDGRSNASQYIYASAQMAITSVIDGEEIREVFPYVYKKEGDVFVIYELDRSGEEDVLIKRYTVYTVETAGSVEYTDSLGKSIYLVKV